MRDLYQPKCLSDLYYPDNRHLLVDLLKESGLFDLAIEASISKALNESRYVEALVKSAPEHIIESLEFNGLLYKGYSRSLKRSLKNEM